MVNRIDRINGRRTNVEVLAILVNSRNKTCAIQRRKVTAPKNGLPMFGSPVYGFYSGIWRTILPMPEPCSMCLMAAGASSSEKVSFMTG